VDDNTQRLGPAKGGYFAQVIHSKGCTINRDTTAKRDDPDEIIGCLV
jgi:hypothetical protein